MLALPVAALILPGLAAWLLFRRSGRRGPGLGLAAACAALALWDLSAAQGAAQDDAAAVNRVMRAGLVWCPALISALAGSLAPRRRP